MFESLILDLDLREVVNDGLPPSPQSGDLAHCVSRRCPEALVSRDMGCLFALIAMLSPRLALLLLWLFTNYVDRAFAGFILPFLGLIFAPWTTLMYVLVDVAPGPIHVAGWILVGLGVLLDLSSYAQSAARRRGVFA